MLFRTFEANKKTFPEVEVDLNPVLKLFKKDTIRKQIFQRQKQAFNVNN